MKLKLKQVQNITIDLTSIGCYEATLQELIAEICKNRRNKFFEILFSLPDGAIIKNLEDGFDAVAFKSLLEPFSEPFHKHTSNYEGSLEYEITVNGNWKLACKTSIVWHPRANLSFGAFNYITEIDSTSKYTKLNSLHTVHGSSANIKMIRNDVTPVTYQALINRASILI